MKLFSLFLCLASHAIYASEDWVLGEGTTFYSEAPSFRDTDSGIYVDIAPGKASGIVTAAAQLHHLDPTAALNFSAGAVHILVRKDQFPFEMNRRTLMEINHRGGLAVTGTAYFADERVDKFRGPLVGATYIVFDDPTFQLLDVSQINKETVELCTPCLVANARRSRFKLLPGDKQ